MKITGYVTPNGISITPEYLSKHGLFDGDRYQLSKYKEPIMDEQRAMIMAYFGWCIENGLKAQGHFSKDGLYKDAQAWLVQTYPADFPEGVSFSRTGLNKERFDYAWKLIDHELMGQFFGIDTGRFWAEYEQYKASGAVDYATWKVERNGPPDYNLKA